MPDPLSSLLKDLLQVPGLPGYEGPVRERLKAEWGPLVDELHISRVGSLQALKRGSGTRPRRSLMLAAHMDAIGLMVSSLADGFLRLAAVGGVGARVLPGQPVLVHARRELPGLIVQPPASCLPPEKTGSVPLEHLFVDVGLPPSHVRRLVRPGDPVTFAQPPLEISEDRIAGPSMDNRVSLAALTLCLQELQLRPHTWDVLVVATVQEELGTVGARTSAYGLRPDLALAVDATFARGPGQPEHMTFPLGGGPTNGWGPQVHPGIFRAIQAAAERIGVPTTVEPMPVSSGTDADVMQNAAGAIPTGVVSIPVRYMHTPVEVASLSDIRSAGRLLAEFAASLEADFLERLSWD
jgi:endoglucanase